MRTSARTLTIAVSLVWAFPAASWAQTYWQADNGNWADGPNWSAGEPTGADDAYISNGGRCNLVYPGEECDYLVVGDGAGESGLLVVYNNGDLTASNALIGHYGTGTVTHAAGAITASTTVFLGNVAGSSGTYGMSGTAQLTTWDLTVGYFGTGELSVTGGADVSTYWGYIGRRTGGEGTVTVDGAGSTLTLDGDLHVGGELSGPGGTGTLTIDNGGLVDVDDMLRAYSGTINFTSGTLRADTLELVGGADLNTGASSTLDVPTATLSGAGTTWTHSSSLMVETGKVASVTVTDDADVSSGILYIASTAGTTGSATLSDPSSTWDVAGQLYVGRYGDATMEILDGAEVNSSYGYIARYGGSTSSVSLSASDWFDPSIWNVTNSLEVGTGGDGTLTAGPLGQVNVGTLLKIGPTGTLEIDAGDVTADEIRLEPGATFTVSTRYGGSVTVNTLTGFGNVIDLHNHDLNIGHTGGSGSGAHTVGAGQSIACLELNVGFNAPATLTISNGGQVNAGSTIELGHWLAGEGTVIVTGAGSTLAGQWSMVVGVTRGGHLTVSDGATASAGDNIYVGRHGQADVTGAGSSLSTPGDIQIGDDDGDGGVLNVAAGGTVQWGGTLLVKATGTVAAGEGTLTGPTVEVTGGGDLTTAGNTTLDFDTATVTGAGSIWTHSSTLRIDTHTTGPDSVAVSDGGALSCSYGWVGYNTGHTGSVTVGNLDSTWGVTNNLTVGYYGTGTLTLTDTGIVSCASLDIGRKSSGNGTVTVGAPYPDDLAELHVTGDVNIGPEGTGLLHILDENFVDVGGTVTIHPSGTLNLEGVLYADELALLAGGTYQDVVGDLCVNRLTGFGDSVNLDSTVYFGYGGGSGTHTVGLGQTFACNVLVVGANSTAEFAIEHGGQVSTASGAAIVGLWAGGVGTLTVRHSGSRLDTGGELRVGNWGQGTLNVLDGGFVTAPDLLRIGDEAPGVVTVNGGTITASNGPISVGEGSASGTLTVSNGSLIEWNAAQALNIGANGTVSVSNSELSGGSIQVAGGGSFSSDGASDLNVGSVSVDGNGSGWTHSGTLAIDTGLGIPSLSITGLGLVDVNGTLDIGPGGTVVLNDGVLQADTVNDPGTGTFIFTAGRLSVGTYQGSLNNQGGTVAPGLSPGTMTVTGDYTQAAGGALEIEIAGAAPGQWDVLAVTGTANLDGTLDVVLDGYTPAAGDSFEVLTYGSRSGEFATITGWENGGLANLAIYGSNDLTLHVTYMGDATLDHCVDGLDYVAWSNNYLMGDTWDKGDFNGDLTADGLDYVIWSNNYWSGCPGAPGPVPEPTGVLLLALGGLALLRRKRQA